MTQFDPDDFDPCGAVGADAVSRIVGQQVVLAGVAYPPWRDDRSNTAADPNGGREYRNTKRPVGLTFVCFVDDARMKNGTVPSRSGGTTPGTLPLSGDGGNFDFFVSYMTEDEWATQRAHEQSVQSSSGVQPAISCDEPINGYEPTLLCSYAKPFGDHVLHFTFVPVEPGGPATTKQRTAFVTAVLNGMP